MAKTPKKANIGDLDPGSPEWLKAFDALGPQDQAAIFNFQTDPTQGMTNIGDTGPTEADPLNWQGIAAGLQGGGSLAGTGGADPFGGPNAATLDPMYQQLLQFGGGVNMPQYTAAGKLDPYDIGQEQARNNLAQDQASSLADLVQAALAGPGALDPSSFADVVTPPKERIATPGLNELDRYARGTGYKAYIAQKIRGGATDDEATADLYNFLSTPDTPNATDQDRQVKQEIIDSLPGPFGGTKNQVQPPSGGNAQGGAPRTGGQAGTDVRNQFDEAGIAKFANDLITKVEDDRAQTDVGYQDPKTGFYYKDQPTSEPSAAAQKFTNLGLPSPFAAYDDPKYLQMGYDAAAPNADVTGQSYYQNLDRLQQESDKAQRAATDLGRSNTATQQLFRQTGGYQPQPVLQRPSPMTVLNEQPNNYVQGRTMGPTLSYGTNPGGGTTAGGGLPPKAPSTMPQFTPNNAIDTYSNLMGPAPQRIQGLQGPNGGFDFAQTPGRSAQTQAMGNAALNFFGGGKRPTKTVELNQATAKQSQQQADKARNTFIKANADRFRASQGVTQDQAAMIRAYEAARSQANQGRKPFTDAVMQRLLAQRALGLRGY